MGGQAQRRRLELAIERAGEPPRAVTFTRDVIVIGRPRLGDAPDLDLSPDATVSRPHARIVADDRGVWIEDLDSKSGTLVNHRNIRGHGRWQLCCEDVVAIGATRLRVVSAPSRAAAAEATAPAPAAPAATPAVAAVPAAATAATAAPPPIAPVVGEIPVGTMVGDYEIRERIAEGAMGVVYRAEQRQPVQRPAALKIVKLRVEASDLLQRFALEQQAMAMMQHDGIAKVFDAGVFADGTPWFAMEFVPGLPIDEHCDAVHATVDERVDLVRRVCLAVQHAHERGVVHRDLKPGNVLVLRETGGALPKVIDFGLARSLGPALGVRIDTEPGRLLGTFEYMAPEQAAAGARSVDARADVYALGVILQELIVGTVPFPASGLLRDGLLEMRRILAEDRPPPPSACLGDPALARQLAEKRRTTVAMLRDELRRELDWIVARALQKNPSDRYATAAALADDLGRYLARRPVAARPPSFGYALSRLRARILRPWRRGGRLGRARPGS